jgi:hypothetical protein
MKDLQKIKEFFSKPLKEERDIYDEIANEEFGMDYDQLGPNEKEWVRDEISNMDEAVTAAYESVKEGNHNAEDFKPYVVKDKNNPNFLKVFIQYPTGTGFTTALGQRTMTGQDREYGADKAMKIGQAVAAKLESKYNLEDIEVSDNDAGKVIVFAVSDDFIKMNTPSLDEAKDPDHLEKVRNIARALPHRYNIKPNMGMVKVTSRSKDELVALKTELTKANLYSEMRPTLAGMFELTVLDSPINEAKEEDAVDTITMDIPLFLRMLEYSREDAKKDLDLHDVTEKANKLGKEKGILSMEDYEEIVGAAEEINEAELNEANVPSNIAEFAKRKGVSSLVRKVAGWAEKVGARIAGGTAVGKNYSTLVLDLDYKQQGEIRIDTDEETVTLYDEPINNFNQFERVYRYGPVSEEKDLDEGMGGEIDEKYFVKVSNRDARKAIGTYEEYRDNFDIKKYDDTLYASNTPSDIYDFYYDLSSQDIEIDDWNIGEDDDYDYDSEYEKTLRETIKFIKENNPKATSEEVIFELKEIKKLGNQLNEELCSAGKAYIKRRQAAGEKSSAYLSGRAVKVCKGQMSGRAKKKK